MALQIFNTLTRAVEPLVPRDSSGKNVSLYCCGPTIHDFAHIGNFRTFVFSDVLRRFLAFRGHQVTHVMNITDVEDKIIKRVNAAKVSLKEYTSKYEQAFRDDLKSLHCLDPHHTPRATEYIQEMIDLIARLMDRGIAYQAGDRSIYFSIEKYQGCGCRYGQLVNLNFDEMRPGERVKNDEYEKESVADFALWKARVPEDGEIFWDSPWGQGRPGWHIECSAMSMKLLGPSFDLHLGGEDLAFPHHEDEIAQSEGAALQEPGQRFVRYWMHGAHLLVDGKKMSKSLGNYYTLRDLLERGYSGREIRYLLMSAHYRQSFNFTLAGLDGARAALGRIQECLGKLQELAANTAPVSPEEKFINEFGAALDDDLNVAAAWGVVFGWVNQVNRDLAQNAVNAERAASLLAEWRKVDLVLALNFEEPRSQDEDPALVSLLEERQAARKAKDFRKADEIRDLLKTKGYVIEDTPKGPRLKKI